MGSSLPLCHPMCWIRPLRSLVAHWAANRWSWSNPCRQSWYAGAYVGKFCILCNKWTLPHCCMTHHLASWWHARLSNDWSLVWSSPPARICQTIIWSCAISAIHLIAVLVPMSVRHLLVQKWQKSHPSIYPSTYPFVIPIGVWASRCNNFKHIITTFVTVDICIPVSNYSAVEIPTIESAGL